MPIRFFSSLRGRLITLITVVFAVLFVALLLFHAQAKQHDRDEAFSRALDLARGFATHYDRILGDKLVLIDTFLRLPGLDLNDPAGCRKHLNYIISNHPSLVNLVAVDAAGKPRCAALDIDPADTASHPAIRHAIDSQRAIVGMSGEGRHGHGRAAHVVLAKPLMDGAGRMGTVILAFIDRDWLNARFAETVPAGVVLRILDGNGIFVVRQPNPECCVGKPGRQLLGIGEALASGSEQVVQSRWLDGIVRLQADLPLKAPLSGVISIGVPEDVVRSNTSRGLAHMTGLLAALCLLSYLVVWFFSDRFILRPVRALSDSARMMREGNLGVRVPALPGKGEFAELGEDFNEMAEALQARQQEIESDLEKLDASGRAFRESEAQLRVLYEQARLAASVFDQAREAITITDEKATILAVNRGFSEITGYRADEVIGKNPRILKSGRQDAEFYRAMWAALLALGHWSGEIWNRRKDGTIYPEWLSLSAVRDEAGQVTNFVAVFTDLTERVAAEQSIRASEYRYRSMIENAPEGVWIIGADEGTIEVNQRLCDLLGYTAQEMRGRKPTDFTDGDNRRIFEMQRDCRALTHHRAYEIELRHRNGRNIPVHFSASNLYQEDGALHSVLAFVTDLTARRAGEARLRESEARLTTLIEAIPDAIFFKDGESRWRVINAAAEKLFAVGNMPWQGKTDLEMSLLQPEMSGEHMACWKSDEAAWSNGSPTHSIEVAHRGEEGIHIYDVCKVPLFDDAGNRNALVIIGRDITEQHRSAEELQRLNDELESRVAERTQALQAANRELGAFSYSVSHDLRAPLRAINGFSHMLEEEYAGALDEKARSYLSRVRAGSERMGQLIDDLLHLSQTSRQPMHVVPTNLSEIAAEIAAELQAGEPQRRAEWVIAPDIMAAGDAGLLRVVMLNLLGNAWKYSSKRPDPRIEFGLAEMDGRSAYFVRDNGTGFDMAHAAHLFGAFQRLHSPSEFPGSGIGLATVARIIHRHGGEVWTEGKVGEGATFYFTLQSPSANRNHMIQ